MSLEISTETTFLLDMVNLEFGPELNTTSNAIADPNGSEADAITGWTETGLNGTGANVFESQGAVKNTGSYSFHMDSNDTPTNNAAIQLDLNSAPFSCTNGNSYRGTFDWRHIGSNGDWKLYSSPDKTTGTEIYDTISSGETTFISVVITWTHSADTRYLVVSEGSGSNDGGVYFDNLSIRQIL